jgi:branched-chain amino acid transport system substrate-binding protein
VTLTVIDAVVNAGVTMFSPANTSKELSTYDDKGLYFRNAPSDILQGAVLAEVIAEDGNSAIAIINLDDSYGNGLAEDLTKSFEDGGGEVLTTVAYAPDAQTFESEVNEIVGTDPDAIVIAGFEESARIVAELIEQGYGPQDVPIYGTDGNMGNATGEEFEAGG